MPWNEPGGDKDPWSGKKKKKSSGSGSTNPADKVTELFSSMSDGGGGKFLYLIPLILVALWVISGFYTIEAGQRGVVLHFGKFKEVATPGLHWIPRPVEKVEVVDIDRNRSASDHMTMLTKDENIVDLKIEVQYLLSNPTDYLFNVKDVDSEDNQEQGVLFQVMRSAVRQVVGRNDMDFVIKEGRRKVEEDTNQLMQTILDEYKSGLQIQKVNLKDATAPEPVKDAFLEATRAREDFNRSKNRAETYANKVIPEARGKAARSIEEANAYKDKVVAQAEGDASRFVNLAKEYHKAPEVTRERLYLDAMEKIMSGSKKVILDASSGNNIMYLPLTGDAASNATSSVPSVPVDKALLEHLKSEVKDKERLRDDTRSAVREGR